ncbi:MAG: hypothetical protein ACOC0P_07395, partial [Planctomycetota bacterium]
SARSGATAGDASIPAVAGASAATATATATATTTLDKAFRAHFGTEDGLPENLNASHELVLVAAELDDSSERIIEYLSEEHGVAINAVFFRVFQDGEHEYLTRAWLTDPEKVEKKVIEKREKLPWNGEYYAYFGADPNRDWEEARRYGFISAGGGRWYSRTIRMVEPGHRVWVNIPGGVGYVGVGLITDEAVPVEEFEVENGSGTMVPITSLPLKAANFIRSTEDEEKAEYLVRVEWIKTLPVSEAVREPGLFVNGNLVAKPRNRQWLRTVERLKELWGGRVGDSAESGNRANVESCIRENAMHACLIFSYKVTSNRWPCGAGSRQHREAKRITAQRSTAQYSTSQHRKRG